MQTFSVPFKHGMPVLDGLLYIKENMDSSLAFRTSCRMGICGSCAMMINDYPHLACHTQIEEFHTDTLTVKPLPNAAIIKDLVPDLQPMFEKHKSVKPFIIRHDDKDEMEEPTLEFSQTPEQLDSFLQFTYCIKCGICVAACPTSSSSKQFLGPQALAQAYRYCADSRDGGQEQRLSIAGRDKGVWHCHFASACSEACPKGLDPALAIQLLKRELVSSSFGGKKNAPASLIATPVDSKPKVKAPDLTVSQK
jgi:succinate dehydrogenase / fumarate reductase iron-sulfur subunit